VLYLVSGVGLCVFGVFFNVVCSVGCRNLSVKFDLVFGVVLSVGCRNLNVLCWV